MASPDADGRLQDREGDTTLGGSGRAAPPPGLGTVPAPPAHSTAITSPADTVRLISADGFVFVLSRQAALASDTIKNMLSNPGHFTEALQNEIVFRDIKAVILQKVCQYLYYKVKYSQQAMSASASATATPDFPIEPEIALELLMAADFLSC